MLSPRHISFKEKFALGIDPTDKILVDIEEQPSLEEDVKVIL